jgi:hypothetical protein
VTAKQRNRRTRRERERLTQKRAAVASPSRPFSGPVELTAADLLAAAADVQRAWSTDDDTAESIEDTGPRVEWRPDEETARHRAERIAAGYSERESDAVDEARACLRLCRAGDLAGEELELTREVMAVTALDALRLAVRLDDADAWLRSAA